MRAQHAIAVTVDTVKDAGYQRAIWFPPPGTRIQGPAAVGSFLRARFMEDPTLTVYDAVAVLLAEHRARRAPYQLTTAIWQRQLAQTRRGPYRTIVVLDRRAHLGPYVTLDLGESRYRGTHDMPGEDWIADRTPDPAYLADNDPPTELWMV